MADPRYIESMVPRPYEDNTLRTKNNICKRFMHSSCDNPHCIYLHDLSKAMPCRTFAQNGYCPKGENCDYLHNTKNTNGDTTQGVYICKNFREKGYCNEGSNCPYKHSKIICKAYAKGFCQLGPDCKDLHEETIACKNYLLGFCPNGPTCSYAQ